MPPISYIWPLAKVFASWFFLSLKYRSQYVLTVRYMWLSHRGQEYKVQYKFIWMSFYSSVYILYVDSVDWARRFRIKYPVYSDKQHLTPDKVLFVEHSRCTYFAFSSTRFMHIRNLYVTYLLSDRDEFTVIRKKTETGGNILLRNKLLKVIILLLLLL